jgi:hypothetical protein
MELAVGVFKGLRDALDRLDHVETFQELRVDLARVADEPQNRAVLADGDVDVEASAF